MRMLVDWHSFEYSASVPWPAAEKQIDWEVGVRLIENWLNDQVGTYQHNWAWSDSSWCYRIGVAFRWDQDRTLFVLNWA
jgi:hypothetical protein